MTNQSELDKFKLYYEKDDVSMLWVKAFKAMMKRKKAKNGR